MSKEEVVVIDSVKTLYFKKMFFFMIKELTAILFWVYAILKLFLFDIDLFLINTYFPSLKWIFHHKFLITLFLVTICVTVANKLNKLLWIVYILFYPIIFIFWRIPNLLYKTKSWIITIGLVNVLIIYCKSLRYNLLMATISLISIFLVLLISNKYIIGLSILVILNILLIIFINRFIRIFKPSEIYKIQSNMICDVLDFHKDKYQLNKEIKDVSIINLNETQLEQWRDNLQLAVIANRLCYYLASKLRDYQKSKASLVFDLINLLLLTLVTIGLFSVMNYGLYEINNNNFATTNQPSFFLFFYYSTKVLFGSGITEITPIMTTSMLLSLVENLFTVFLIGGVFLTLIISVKNERNINEIEEAINKIKKQGDEIDLLINKEYKITIDNAIKELDRLKSDAISFIYYLSKDIK